MNNHCYVGDCRDILKTLRPKSVQCCVTSPPYWGLRDYGVDGQIGLEPSLAQYIASMVDVFALVRNILADDGVCWINMGDTMLPNKCEAFAPHRLAIALVDNGWICRQTVVWSKPNPMPESVCDRCTKAHEYVFMLTKNRQYFYDADAIKEPAIYFDDDRKGRANDEHKSAPDEMKNGIRAVYKDARSYEGKNTDKQRGHGRRHAGFNDRWDSMTKDEQCSAMRNKRSVWTVATQGYAEAHFATFPEKLIEPMILAGSRIGDTVLDPFMGSGTTARVAQRLGRNWIGCELNPAYVDLQADRTRQMAMAV